MITRRIVLAGAAALAFTASASAQDWKAKYPELTFAVVPAENASQASPNPMNGLDGSRKTPARSSSCSITSTNEHVRADMCLNRSIHRISCLLILEMGLGTRSSCMNRAVNRGSTRKI